MACSPRSASLGSFGFASTRAHFKHAKLHDWISSSHAPLLGEVSMAKNNCCIKGAFTAFKPSPAACNKRSLKPGARRNQLPQYGELFLTLYFEAALPVCILLATLKCVFTSLFKISLVLPVASCSSLPTMDHITRYVLLPVARPLPDRAKSPESEDLCVTGLLGCYKLWAPSRAREGSARSRRPVAQLQADRHEGGHAHSRNQGLGSLRGIDAELFSFQH